MQKKNMAVGQKYWLHLTKCFRKKEPWGSRTFVFVGFFFLTHRLNVVLNAPTCAGLPPGQELPGGPWEVIQTYLVVSKPWVLLMIFEAFGQRKINKRPLLGIGWIICSRFLKQNQETIQHHYQNHYQNHLKSLKIRQFMRGLSRVS